MYVCMYVCMYAWIRHFRVHRIVQSLALLIFRACNVVSAPLELLVQYQCIVRLRGALYWGQPERTHMRDKV